MAKIFYCVLIFSLIWCIGAQKCTTQTACSCFVDEYTTINLKELPLPKGGYFQDGGVPNAMYFFSGCENRQFDPKDYNLIANSTIAGASLVKCNSIIGSVNVTDPKTNQTETKRTIEQECNSIGSAKDIQFEEVSSSTSKDQVKYQLVYKSNEPPSKNLPTIQLACDSYNLTSLKIQDPVSNVLILYSPLSCLQYKTHHELSNGSVICIIYFVAVFIYFVGGAAVMYFVRGARGVEIIPNYEFWCSLPGLMRDGIMYLFNGCRPLTLASAEAYDRI